MVDSGYADVDSEFIRDKMQPDSQITAFVHVTQYLENEAIAETPKAKSRIYENFSLRKSKVAGFRQ